MTGTEPVAPEHEPNASVDARMVFACVQEELLRLVDVSQSAEQAVDEIAVLARNSNESRLQGLDRLTQNLVGLAQLFGTLSTHTDLDIQIDPSDVTRSVFPRDLRDRLRPDLQSHDAEDDGRVDLF
ncbi:MAG: hypothetical protein AAF830_00770 [Pseudomonadota bacterium]